MVRWVRAGVTGGYTAERYHKSVVKGYAHCTPELVSSKQHLTVYDSSTHTDTSFDTIVDTGADTKGDSMSRANSLNSLNSLSNDVSSDVSSSTGTAGNTGRVFAYCRVSTTEQSTENQILSIRRAGYDVPAHRVVQEQVSGSQQALQRKEFAAMVQHKLEPGDTLVVLKLDRLGRDNIDVQNCISMLTSKGIRVVCLDLPVQDLSSAEGKLMLQMFSAFAEFERNRIRERTQEGLARVKAEGKQLGRPVATGTTKDVQHWKAQGLSQSKVAAKLGIGIATVKRHWNKLQS